MTLRGIAYENLPTFVMFGVALTNAHDFGISFASPWAIVPAGNTDPFGAFSLSGQIPDFQGVTLTVYAQALLPYSAARCKQLLFSEVATIAIN